MKPKSNRKPGPMDNCQTPPYALDPLIPFLKSANIHTIWEPAVGEGYLSRALRLSGFDVVDTDINDKYGELHDFFKYEAGGYDAIVTNPPYSMKSEWTFRCFQLRKPWALLMPVEFLGTVKACEMFGHFGVQVMFLYPRVNFKMPNKGWSGGGAQFPTAWYTYGLNLSRDNMFVRIHRDAKGVMLAAKG